MNTPRVMPIVRLNPPLKLALTYAGFGILWILGSDAWVAWWSRDGTIGRWTELIKGLAFIAVTTALLYSLTRRLIARNRVAELALRESEQRLALAMEAASQGLYDFNVQTGEVKVNEAFATMLGHDPAHFRMSRERWEEQLHPDDRERTIRLLTEYLEGRMADFRTEFRLKTASGDWRWVLSAGRVVERDETGRPLRMLGTHTDISGQKKAEADMADVLALLRAMLESSPVGVIAYGPDGRAIIANESAAHIVGTDVATLLQQNFRDLESWRRAGLLELAERALATGRGERRNTALHTSFGRHLQVEVQLVPFDFRGTRHLMAVIADETDKRQALDHLRLLDQALQAAPSACVITDAGGVIKWVNPAFSRATGYTAAEAIGQSTRLLRSGRHSPDFYRQLWDTIRAGEVWSGDIRNRRKDGTCYDEHMTIAPVRDGDGAIGHFVAIKEDVTERKQLEQQLARTQRLESIGLLASGIAHDLNNVLTPIMLSIELLRAKYPAAEAGKFVETILAATQRGAGIVRQVLTFARGLDGGERAPLQPRYLLKDVVHLIEETFPRNIEIVFAVPQDLHSVMGDITQLHQVILNLAVNARDAMPQGGILTLSARNFAVPAGGCPAHPQLKPGEHVALVVADTGTGISSEVLEHMFEPFFTTKPRGKGTGLGLSTVYGIVRSHDGTIEVKTRLGQGSAFEVLLPATAVAAADAFPREGPPVIKGAGRRVLVVDDEESIRSVAQRVLRAHGFVPVLAVDGTDGLRAVLGNPGDYAVAIVDMMMPRMNGSELVRNLRIVAPDLPVIVSTGLMDEQEADGPEAGLRRQGVHTFLAKPYTAEQLLAALARELKTTSDQVG